MIGGAGLVGSGGCWGRSSVRSSALADASVVGVVVGASSSRRSGALPTRLLAVCVCGAFLFGSLLPALALAEEPPDVSSCPGAGLEIPDEMAQPEREIRGLRNDLRALCQQLLSDDLPQLARLEGIESGLQSVVEADHGLGDQVHALSEQLELPDGSPVRIVGSEAVVETRSSAPTEGAIEGNFERVEQAVVTGTETSNSNLWGLAGLFVGFGTLFCLYKMVRP